MDAGNVSWFGAARNMAWNSAAETGRFVQWVFGTYMGEKDSFRDIPSLGSSVFKAVGAWKTGTQWIAHFTGFNQWGNLRKACELAANGISLVGTVSLWREFGARVGLWSFDNKKPPSENFLWDKVKSVADAVGTTLGAGLFLNVMGNQTERAGNVAIGFSCLSDTIGFVQNASKAYTKPKERTTSMLKCSKIAITILKFAKLCGRELISKEKQYVVEAVVKVMQLYVTFRKDTSSKSPAVA